MLSNMRKERLERGMSIKEVASSLGVHPNAVSRWETGKAEPTSSNLLVLCRLYECTPEYLLDMTKDKNAVAIAN